MATPLLAVTDIAYATNRSQRERLQTDLLVTSSTIIALLGLLWGLIYVYIGAVQAGSIPIMYAAFSFASIGYYALTGRSQFFRFSQLLLMLIFPTMLMIVLGGFVNSSGVILWSLTSPVGALLFSSRRKAAVWFVGFIAVVIFAGLVDAGIIGLAIDSLGPGALSDNIIITFFIMNAAGPSTVVFLLLSYFTYQRDRTHDLLVSEQAKSNQLLINILPQSIARRLMDGQERIADCFKDASILFADIAGFTPLSADLGVEGVVDLLNDLHTGFDEIMERRGLEKIRTIGDGYMAASGVPTPRHDHAQALADAALDMVAYTRDLSARYGFPIQLRVGINSGTIMAGVIGRNKFSYDIWGDAVNVASRMESHGVADGVQISEHTHALLKREFITEPRGIVDIKGKGQMPTWLLIGRR